MHKIYQILVETIDNETVLISHITYVCVNKKNHKVRNEVIRNKVITRFKFSLINKNIISDKTSIKHLIVKLFRARARTIEEKRISSPINSSTHVHATDVCTINVVKTLREGNRAYFW